jgi:hypothetical protein
MHRAIPVIAYARQKNPLIEARNDYVKDMGNYINPNRYKTITKLTLQDSMDLQDVQAAGL